MADAALEASPGQPPSVERSLELVHAAARRETLEPKEVFAAIRVLEKQRKQVCDGPEPFRLHCSAFFLLVALFICETTPKAENLYSICPREQGPHNE